MKNIDERFTPEERAAQTLYWKFLLIHIVKGIFKGDLMAYLPDIIVGKGEIPRRADVSIYAI